MLNVSILIFGTWLGERPRGGRTHDQTMSPRFSLSAVPTSRRATVSTYTTGFCRCSCAKAKFAFPTYRNQQNRWISKAPKSAWPRSFDDFSLENVKSSSFAKAHIIYGTGGQLKRSTSAEYFACAKAFALAVENGSNPAATYLLDRESHLRASQ